MDRDNIYQGPSVVWCGRAPYYVQQSQTEVTDMADSCLGRYGFIYLDLVSKQGATLQHQVALRIEHISAVERFEP